MNIIPPTIHLNGTSAKMLQEGYEAAYNAIRAAQDAFSRIEFNSRDYYVKSPNAWENAQDERYSQALKLAQVEDYLLQHLISIQNQTTK